MHFVSRINSPCKMVTPVTIRILAFATLIFDHCGNDALVCFSSLGGHAALFHRNHTNSETWVQHLSHTSSHISASILELINCPDGTKHTQGGGGYGQNWLWTEYLDTRKSPSEWVEVLDDTSECGSVGNTRVCTGNIADGEESCNSRWDDKMGSLTDETGEVYHWRNFTEEAAKENCEKPDKKTGETRCKWINLQFAQGSYRCVPAIQPGDRRFDEAHTSARHKAAAQKFYASWQRPLQPFMGQPAGALLASRTGGGIAGGNDRGNDPRPGSDLYNGANTFNKAFQRTRDICLKYKQSRTRLPHGRVRCLRSVSLHSLGAPTDNVLCLSQQFRWFADQNNLMQW